MSFSYRFEGNDLILNVLVQTRANKNEITGECGDVIKIRIKAAPIDGMANKQLQQFIAEVFNVSKQCVNITKGQSSKHKQIRIKNPKKIIPWMKKIKDLG